MALRRLSPLITFNSQRLSRFPGMVFYEGNNGARSSLRAFRSEFEGRVVEGTQSLVFREIFSSLRKDDELFTQSMSFLRRILAL